MTTEPATQREKDESAYLETLVRSTKEEILELVRSNLDPELTGLMLKTILYQHSIAIVRSLHKKIKESKPS